MLCRLFILIFLVSFLRTGGLFTQSVPLIIGDKDFVELDFDYSGSLIIINATLAENYPVKLILDTGAENLILFDLETVRKLGMKPGKKIELRGADLDTVVNAFICRQIPTKLGDCQSVPRDFIALENDLLHIEQAIGLKVDGILGGRALWGLIMEIDYHKNKVRLYKHGQLDPKKLSKFHKLDLEMHQHKPYIKTKTDVSPKSHIETKLLVDTGSSLGFLLLLESHPSLELPQYYIKGPLGKGFGGDILGFITRTKALRLSDGLFFPNPITHLQYKSKDIPDHVLNNRNGLLGNPILSRFTMIIDYLNADIYFKPIKQYNRKSDYDRSGLMISAYGKNLNQFVVRYVLEDSPASKAGIQIGDKILKLGFIPLKWRTLSKVTSILARNPGYMVKMTLERDGKVFKTQFRLKDYLKVPT